MLVTPPPDVDPLILRGERARRASRALSSYTAGGCSCGLISRIVGEPLRPRSSACVGEAKAIRKHAERWVSWA